MCRVLTSPDGNLMIIGSRKGRKEDGFYVVVCVFLYVPTTGSVRVDLNVLNVIGRHKKCLYVDFC